MIHAFVQLLIVLLVLNAAANSLSADKLSISARKWNSEDSETSLATTSSAEISRPDKRGTFNFLKRYHRLARSQDDDKSGYEHSPSKRVLDDGGLVAMLVKSINGAGRLRCEMVCEK
ncbi:hypothetical protein Tcan_03261 [Toxocara canis]|uniref:Uncharacterized protein n=1 Tax=Toxocara canis TaxID=6265 RepID=A0A0B2VGZ0_TOXCA|nr:hypothetical protein Tcan_03261 [Toxocara canis]